MRLVNTLTYHLVDCPEPEITDYAILSHTWTDHELSLQDWQLIHYQYLTPPPEMPFACSPCAHCRSMEDHILDLRSKRGYRKIASFLAQAQRDGFEYAWADTICVDRTNSGEVEESVIGAWAYYESSGACYVYLEDVEAGGVLWRDTWTEKALQQFENARWWRRGWTLMELLAARRVRFFDREWGFFGTKVEERVPVGGGVVVKEGIERYAHWSLAREIVRWSGIEERELRGFERGSVSVARKMGWIRRRSTRREEDKAYALMGLLGVCMPVLYGEGGLAAYRRLERAIAESSDDGSIFKGQRDSYENGASDRWWNDSSKPSFRDFTPKLPPDTLQSLERARAFGVGDWQSKPLFSFQPAWTPDPNG